MQQIQTYYDEEAAREWNRLDRHPTEFALNMRFLHEYLPSPPANVLDVGGGPGRYSIALAREGYRVTLFDLSQNCLAFARAKAAETGVTLHGTIHGNALDLGALPDGAFDAVLLMGPMYHLLTQADRGRALQEAHRVLKPGGVLAVAFIGRYACVAAQEPEWVAGHVGVVEQELTTGIRDRGDSQFLAYATHPGEVQPMLEANGFTYIEMIASEGLQFRAEAAAMQLQGAQWEAWVDINYRLAKDPSVHGAAVHLFAVARRR